MSSVTYSALLSDPALASRARQRSAATRLMVTRHKDSGAHYSRASTFVATDATREILETNANYLATDLAMALEPTCSPNLTLVSDLGTFKHIDISVIDFALGHQVPRLALIHRSHLFPSSSLKALMRIPRHGTVPPSCRC